MRKQGQVTIFVILAIVIVGAVIIFYSLDFNLNSNISAELQPAYDYYLGCVEQSSREAINLLGEQGGRIEAPEFVPGSAYKPFSSELDFFGQGVPYWMYVTGNNILKEQVPTKDGMEFELAKYVQERLTKCDFTDLELQGYTVYIDEGEVNAKINDLGVDIDVKNSVTIYFENQSAIVKNHKISLGSKLGKFYKLARNVYDYEKTDMFLEDYAIDVMRLYAPVTGTEIGCAPKIFVDEDIQRDIVDGLVTNIPSLKLKGDYYDLSSKAQSYFVTDPGFKVKENVNFMYSSDWPTRIEIFGDRVAKPVGMQEGFGILGFCYVPYHLVYDIDFPVMVQFFDDEEIFQFPVSVIISKNSPRQALPSVVGSSIESPVCQIRGAKVDVSTYDAESNPVESRIQFKCLDSVCAIGDTQISGDSATLTGDFPACVNGIILASSEGYANSKYLISTNEQSSANIFLDKKYEMALNLGNVEKALINFNSEEFSATVLYPEFKSVELIEGYYNVSVQVYDNSSLKFPATSEQKCVDVPEKGIAGFLGAETEKCFTIDFPETDISFAIVGGGKTQEYITEDQLKGANGLNINVPLFGLPQKLEDLQKNNLLSEEETIYLSFE